MQARLRTASTASSPLCESAPASPAAGSRATPADTRISALRSPMRASATTAVRPVNRRLQTQQRLGRLRQELAKIRPAPSCPEEARDEILGALARAGLGDWTVPELTDRAVRRCASGSLCVPLISHVLVFNPTGAFRIVDVFAGQQVYFEMAARCGAPFDLPPDAMLRT
jgi:hypothetical protein